MKALSITLKDLQLLLKDRGSLFQLFPAAPAVHPRLQRCASTPSAAATGDTRLALAVVNLDGGTAAQTLLASIDAAGGVRTELYDQAKAEAMLDKNELEPRAVHPGWISAPGWRRQSGDPAPGHPSGCQRTGDGERCGWSWRAWRAI